MDPFHQRHRRPENDFGYPGLPRYNKNMPNNPRQRYVPAMTHQISSLFSILRGAVPPGARFDPFGPVSPDGDIGRNPRSGRFSG